MANVNSGSSTADDFARRIEASLRAAISQHEAAIQSLPAPVRQEVETAATEQAENSVGAIVRLRNEERGKGTAADTSVKPQASQKAPQVAPAVINPVPAPIAAQPATVGNIIPRIVGPLEADVIGIRGMQLVHREELPDVGYLHPGFIRELEWSDGILREMGGRLSILPDADLKEHAERLWRGLTVQCTNRVTGIAMLYISLEPPFTIKSAGNRI